MTLELLIESLHLKVSLSSGICYCCSPLWSRLVHFFNFFSFLHFISFFSILFCESPSNPGDDLNLDKRTTQNTRTKKENINLTENWEPCQGERSILMRAVVSNRRHSNEENCNIIRFCISREVKYRL